MDFIRELGPLALDHRFRRLTETLLRTAEEVYQARGLRFRARWTSTFLLLERDGPMAVTEIAQQLRLTHPAVIGITDEMRGAGLVSNIRDRGDARRRPMALTPAARQLAPVLRGVWQVLALVQRERFTEAGCDVLAVLERVEDGLAERNLTGEILQRLELSSSTDRRAMARAERAP
jgi:DNA-binding MarR family transcriptional regulator